MENQIAIIFNENKLHDLKTFIKKREAINQANTYLTYIFGFLQLAGMFVTSHGTSQENTTEIWAGVGLTALANFIHYVTRANSKLSQILLKNLDKIKKGTYVDELTVGDIESQKSKTPSSI